MLPAHMSLPGVKILYDIWRGGTVCQGIIKQLEVAYQNYSYDKTRSMFYATFQAVEGASYICKTKDSLVKFAKSLFAAPEYLYSYGSLAAANWQAKREISNLQTQLQSAREELVKETQAYHKHLLSYDKIYLDQKSELETALSNCQKRCP